MPSQKTTSSDYSIWTGATENVPNVPGVTRGASNTNIYSANLNVFGNLNIRGALDYTLTGNTEINDQYLTVAANNSPAADLREGGLQYKTSYVANTLAAIRFYQDANGFASVGGTWQWTPNVSAGVWYNFAVGAANANGTYLTAVVQDPAPQLGGNLDTLNRNIFNSLGGYVSIDAPNGLIPSANAVYDLGAVNANYWRNLFLSGAVNVGGIQISRPAVGVLRIAQSGANASIWAGAVINGNSNITLANSGAVTITPSGNVNAGLTLTNNGNLTVVTAGNISAGYYYGNGRFLTGLPEVYSNANVANYMPIYSGNLANVRGDIGNITFNIGNVYAGNARLLANLEAGNAVLGTNVIAGNASITSNIAAGNITISANLAVGNTANIANLNIAYTGGRANLGNIGNIGIGNAQGANYASGQVIYTDGAGGLYFGNVSAGAAGLTDYIQYNSANVLAADAGFTRNAQSNLTQITGVLSMLQAPNGAANVETINLSVDGLAAFSNIGNITITGGNANFAIVTDGAGNLSFANLAVVPGGANLSFQYNNAGNFAGAVGFSYDRDTANVTMGNVSVANLSAGLANIGNANISSSLEAVYANILTLDVGNLSLPSTSTFTVGNIQLSNPQGNIIAGNIFLQGSDGNIETIGNISANSISLTGTFAANNIGDANVTNYSGANIALDGEASITGNITGGNLNTAGNVVASGGRFTGNITSGNLSTGIVTATGNITGGNLSTGIVTATGNITGGNLSTGIVTATGNITGGNIITAGNVSGSGAVFTGNVTVGNIIGNGRSLTGVVLSVTSANTANINVDNTDAQNPTVDFAGAVVRSVTTGNSSQITIGGTGLNPNVSIAASGVTSGAYGNASIVGTFTVGSDGRITSAANATIALTQNISNTGTTTTLSIPSQTLTITGTTNRVTSSLSAQTFTLTAPQDLHTGAAFQVAQLGVGTAPSGTNGEIVATGNIIAFFSDDRLKTRLGNIENALDKIDAISTFYFEPNETALKLGYPSGRYIGASAQDTQQQIPEIVAPAPLGEGYLTVMYEKFAPLILAGIKELRAEIEEIKRKL